MIKILIADDHKIFREGIASMIEDEEDMVIAGQASDGAELLGIVKNAQPDIILMDIDMGDFNGINATKSIKEMYPQINVLGLSMHNESEFIIKILEAGASGYLVKDAGSLEMMNAIRTIYEGGNYYSQEIFPVFIEHITKGTKSKESKKESTLTKRETEVLKLIVEEYSNAEIAKELFISIRTVDTHKRNLIEKLKVKNTAGLVKYALKHNITK